MRLVVILAVVFAGGYFAYSELLGLGEATTSYRTAAVTTGRLREVVTTSGSVNAVVTVAVGSQLSGQIASLQADFNDVVLKGQALAVIDQQSYQVQLSKANAVLAMAQASIDVRRAEVERAEQDLLIVRANEEILSARLENFEAQLVSADADLRRKRELHVRGTVAITELDQIQARQLGAAAAVREAKANVSVHSIKVAAAQADVMRAGAQLRNAVANIPEKEAQLKLADIELRQTTIRSPIDGIVI